jgi:hypothetical protein
MSWPGAALVLDHLAPHRLGPWERSFLWELLVDPATDLRGEMFGRLQDKELLKTFSNRQSERELVKNVRPRVSEELRRRLDAIEAYESFCRPLHESFDRMQFLSSCRMPGVIRPDDLQKDNRVSDIAARFRTAINTARERLEGSPIQNSFENLAQRFEAVTSGGDLFHALSEHHAAVQKEKPPEGKRPWFEATANGGLIVRAPYRIGKNPPKRDEFVHPYRMFAAVSFIRDVALVH